MARRLEIRVVKGGHVDWKDEFLDVLMGWCEVLWGKLRELGSAWVRGWYIRNSLGVFLDLSIYYIFFSFFQCFINTSLYNPQYEFLNLVFL